MKIVNTTLGPIPIQRLGKVNAHEHVILAGENVRKMYPDFIHDDVSSISDEIASWKHAGGGAIIDSSPIDAGRVIEELVAVSRITGIPVICSTGFHKKIYYPPDHWVFSQNEDELYRVFLRECSQGILFNETNIDEPLKLPIKAGVIKTAIDQSGLSPFTKKVLGAGARTVNDLDVPMFIHTEAEIPYVDTLKWLLTRVNNTRKIVYCHMDKCADGDIIHALLRQGVFIEFDSMVREKPTLAELSTTIIRLFDAGFGARILFGGDLARKSYWKCYGGSPGLAYLMTGLQDEFIYHGVTKKMQAQIWKKNPAKLFG